MLSEIPNQDRLFPESEQISNQNIVNSLIFENRSKTIRQYDPKQFETDRFHKKREREDNYVKNFDPKDRPILVVKEKHHYQTEPREKSFGRQDENQLFMKLSKNTKPIDDMDEEIKVAALTAKSQERVHKKKHDDQAEGYYKIDGIEFLPEGFLELDPLIFRDEYDFNSNTYEKHFQEEQRRIKVLRRKQYEQKDLPKKREVTILVRDEQQNRITEFLESWYFKHKRRMNPQEVDYVSKIMKVTPESIIALQDSFLRAKKIENSKRLNDFLNQGSAAPIDQINKLPPSLQKKLSHKDKFPGVKPKIYEEKDAYKPQILSKYKMKYKKKPEKELKHLQDHYHSEIPKSKAKAETNQLNNYSSFKPTENTTKATKPKWDTYLNDFEGVIKDLNDADVEKIHEEGEEKSKSASKKSDNDHIKGKIGVKHYPKNENEIDLRNYFSEEMKNLFGKFEKLPREEESIRSKSKDSKNLEGISNVEYSSPKKITQQTQSPRKLDELLKDVNKNGVKEVENAAQFMQRDPNARSWAFSSLSEDKKQDLYVEVEKAVEKETPTSQKNPVVFPSSTPQNYESQGISQNLNELSKINKATKPAIPQVFSFDKMPPTVAANEYSSATGENPKKEKSAVLTFLEQPKRVTIVARKSNNDSFLSQKLKPCLIGSHYYYPSVEDETLNGYRKVTAIIRNEKGETISFARIPDNLIGTFYDAWIEDKKLEGDVLDADPNKDAVRLIIKNERGQEVAVLPIVPKADEFESGFDKIQIVPDANKKNTIRASMKRKTFKEERMTLRPFLVGSEYYTQVITVHETDRHGIQADITTINEKGEMINVKDIKPENLGENYVADVVEEKIDDKGKRKFTVHTKNDRGEVISKLDIEPLKQLSAQNFKQLLEEIVDENGNRKLTLFGASDNNDLAVEIEQIRPSRVDVKSIANIGSKSPSRKNSIIPEAAPVTILEVEEAEKVTNPQATDPFERDTVHLPEVMNNYYNELLKEPELNKKKKKGGKIKRFTQFITLPEPVVRFGSVNPPKEKSKSPVKIDVDTLVAISTPKGASTPLQATLTPKGEPAEKAATPKKEKESITKEQNPFNVEKLSLDNEKAQPKKDSKSLEAEKNAPETKKSDAKKPEAVAEFANLPNLNEPRKDSVKDKSDGQATPTNQKSSFRAKSKSKDEAPSPAKVRNYSARIPQIIQADKKSEKQSENLNNDILKELETPKPDPKESEQEKQNKKDNRADSIKNQQKDSKAVPADKNYVISMPVQEDKMSFGNSENRTSQQKPQEVPRESQVKPEDRKDSKANAQKDVIEKPEERHSQNKKSVSKEKIELVEQPSASKEKGIRDASKTVTDPKSAQADSRLGSKSTSGAAYGKKDKNSYTSRISKKSDEKLEPVQEEKKQQDIDQPSEKNESQDQAAKKSVVEEKKPSTVLKEGDSQEIHKQIELQVPPKDPNERNASILSVPGFDSIRKGTQITQMNIPRFSNYASNRQNDKQNQGAYNSTEEDKIQKLKTQAVEPVEDEGKMKRENKWSSRNRSASSSKERDSSLDKQGNAKMSESKNVEDASAEKDKVEDKKDEANVSEEPKKSIKDEQKAKKSVTAQDRKTSQSKGKKESIIEKEDKEKIENEKDANRKSTDIKKPNAISKLREARLKAEAESKKAKPGSQKQLEKEEDEEKQHETKKSDLKTKYIDLIGTPKEPEKGHKKSEFDSFKPKKSEEKQISPEKHETEEKADNQKKTSATKHPEMKKSGSSKKNIHSDSHRQTLKTEEETHHSPLHDKMNSLKNVGNVSESQKQVKKSDSKKVTPEKHEPEGHKKSSVERHSEIKKSDSSKKQIHPEEKKKSNINEEEEELSPEYRNHESLKKMKALEDSRKQIKESKATESEPKLTADLDDNTLKKKIIEVLEKEKEKRTSKLNTSDSLMNKDSKAERDALAEEFFKFCKTELPSDDKYKHSMLLISLFYYFLEKRNLLK